MLVEVIVDIFVGICEILISGLSVSLAATLCILGIIGAICLIVWL